MNANGHTWLQQVWHVVGFSTAQRHSNNEFDLLVNEIEINPKLAVDSGQIVPKLLFTRTISWSTPSWPQQLRIYLSQSHVLVSFCRHVTTPPPE